MKAELKLAAEDKNHCINAISFLEFRRISGQRKSGDFSDLEAECGVERTCSLCITAAWHSDGKIRIAFPRLFWDPVKGGCGLFVIHSHLLHSVNN